MTSGFSGWSSRGIGVRIWQHPDIFDELFPGYLEFLRSSGESLKRRFAAYEFESLVHIPKLYPAGHSNQDDRVVAIPWSACFDFLYNVGADLLIMGNSETFRQIIPAQLRFFLKGASDLKHQPLDRILMCGKSGFTLPAARVLAQGIKNMGQKVRVGLWGVSLWALTLSDESVFLEEANAKRDWNRWEATTGKPQFMNLSLKNTFALPRWEDFDIFSVDEFLARTKAAREWAELHPAVDHLKIDRFHQRANEEGFSVSAELAETNFEIGEFANTAEAHYHHFDTAKDRSCRFELYREKLETTIQQLLESVNKLYIFIPPTTPLHFAMMPKCFRSEFSKFLKTFSNHRIKVLTDDWLDFGLNWQDFLHETEIHGQLKLDVNHTNINGSQKVTERVAAWIYKNEFGHLQLK